MIRSFFRISILLVPIALSGCRTTTPFSSSQLEHPGKTEIHYSPEEDLERIDLGLIHRAQKSIDMPMYAFTDKYLAEAIKERAEHGVHIRIYRDQGQFQEESNRALRRNNSDNPASIFKDQPNIQIKVKGTSTLQHLKSYCIDRVILRDGSANWSPTGEKRQDNSLVIVTSPTAVEHFEQIFDEIWNRTDNQVIQ